MLFYYYYFFVLQRYQKQNASTMSHSHLKPQACPFLPYWHISCPASIFVLCTHADKCIAFSLASSLQNLIFITCLILFFSTKIIALKIQPVLFRLISPTHKYLVSHVNFLEIKYTIKIYFGGIQIVISMFFNTFQI